MTIKINKWIKEIKNKKEIIELGQSQKFYSHILYNWSVSNFLKECFSIFKNKYVNLDVRGLGTNRCKWTSFAKTLDLFRGLRARPQVRSIWVHKSFPSFTDHEVGLVNRIPIGSQNHVFVGGLTLKYISFKIQSYLLWASNSLDFRLRYMDFWVPSYLWVCNWVGFMARLCLRAESKIK